MDPGPGTPTPTAVVAPTTGPSGNVNLTTGASTLDRVTLIVSGPLNGFPGELHLTGTFVPKFLFTTAGLPRATEGSAYTPTLTSACVTART